MDYKPLSDEEALELGRELAEFAQASLSYRVDRTVLISLGRIAYKRSLALAKERARG